MSKQQVVVPCPFAQYIGDCLGFCRFLAHTTCKKHLIVTTRSKIRDACGPGPDQVRTGPRRSRESCEWRTVERTKLDLRWTGPEMDWTEVQSGVRTAVQAVQDRTMTTLHASATSTSKKAVVSGSERFVSPSSGSGEVQASMFTN